MWQLAKACVIIRIKGRNAERLLNALRGAGIPLRRVMRLSQDELRLSMDAKDFKRIRRHAGKLHCRVHIESRGGAPFRLMRLFRRRALWIGLLAGFCAMAAASTRVWFISVEGNRRVAETTIRRALEAQGIRAGAARPDSDFDALADALAAYDERIAWIGLDLDGVRLRVEVVEAEEDMLRLDPSLPCDVVAVKDGVITRMRALEGEAMFAVGDLVRAGDVLISGTVPLADIPEPLLVHARGLVTASVYYFSEYAQPLVAKERAATGRTAPYRRICLAGLTLFESEPPYADYEIENGPETLLRLPLLPVRVQAGEYIEMAERERTLSVEEAAELALVEAEKGALLRVPSDARITQKSSEWTERDGLVVATASVVAEESIGMTKEMQN
ncbi:MAG: sporulation protein YqfD [Clostridia bacterium]|nr:sporulation protein YqfD [Clostridia bacterium]